MDVEIIRMIEHIKQSAGKEIRVYSDVNDDFYSTLETDIPNRFSSKVRETVASEENAKTYFSFKYNAQRYTGYIDGCTDADKTIATLIGTLLENGTGKDLSSGKEDSLTSAIIGEYSGIRLQKVINKYSIPDLPCTATALYVSSGRVEDVVNFMENFKTDARDICVVTDSFTCAYVRFGSSQEDSEYRSLTDFANLLAHSIADELGIIVKIGIGSTVVNFVDCSVSYHQALASIRMDNVFGGKSRVSTYKEYVLVKMLEDMPKHKLQEFLDILEDQEAKSMFADTEMIATAEEFLHTSLNVSETSRNLYMHRNTLMYRLDKIERATGFDIRKFQDAMTFRLIMILHKLLGNSL
ncbi:MAG: helix-turn-helix domain-containing protein [Clostridia bacterium]|nr:helix-turn-helix domain-containing protein [Clostridia bacterium]